MDRTERKEFLYSLPERVLRSLAAITGGVLREVGEVALPARVRRSRLYRSLVDSTLQLLIEQLGRVKGTYGGDPALPDDFMVRRAAGNVIEAAGIVAFRASPVWVLAALADISGAGRDLVAEISEALKKEGLLDPNHRFETIDQLLDGMERTAGQLAETVNTPPLDLGTLRQEWDSLRQQAAHLPRVSLPSPDGIRAQWRELQQEAAAQGRSVFELSSAMAISAVRNLPDNARWLSSAAQTSARRTGGVLAAGLMEHYRSTLAEIRAAGFARYWVREFQPYFKAAVGRFSPREQSTTERLLSRRRKRLP